MSDTNYYKMTHQACASLLIERDKRIVELEKAAEQVVFECEADDDAMMPSVAAVRNLKALIGGNE